MENRDVFARCLQHILDEEGMTASAVSRLVGFRSRNSLQRILNAETSADVDGRFLTALHEALQDAWPQSYWHQLELALDIKRVGMQQHRSNQAFCVAVNGSEVLTDNKYMVEMRLDGNGEERPLGELLRGLSKTGTISVVVCGCCDYMLTACMANGFAAAGSEGRLKIRHYFDISKDHMVENILGVMPLLSLPWYNARLVDEARCSPQMAAFYRMNIISLSVTDAAGKTSIHQMLQCSPERFIYTRSTGKYGTLVDVLDRHRFDLQLLKPREKASEGMQAYLDYTQRCAELEQDGMFLSVKPDVHFQLIPTEILYPAIREGFAQAGLCEEEELDAVMDRLAQIHDRRVENMFTKRRPSHIIYSLPAMEQFMRTGVLTDQFFVQRAYTKEERRVIVSRLLQMMQENPYFNIVFMDPRIPEVRAEMTFFEGKGVALMDAYTSYDLHDDHSEALITLPEFMRSFREFFMDVLLGRLTLNRKESMAQLERLLHMAE